MYYVIFFHTNVHSLLVKSSVCLSPSFQLNMNFVQFILKNTTILGVYTPMLLGQKNTKKEREGNCE
jgi:hypothetical protein